ncbi:MAG: metallophosphoesterase [Polyangiaceae bacterium]
MRRAAGLGFRASALLLLAAGAWACDDGTTGTGGGGGKAPFPDPDPLPALTKAPLTTDVRLQPTMPQAAGGKDPRVPADLENLLSTGYGDEMTIAGEPLVSRTLDQSAAPAKGPNAKLLTRFVHLSDAQLADDESPARVCSLDSPQGATSGAFRPQEGHECNILNATVRTINKIHEAMPVTFVVLGGDNADNAQTNEVDWYSDILDGSKRVECDSGADDDPTPGPMNDNKDPFFAEGLKMPWFWVTGNHDVLNQGNFEVTTMSDQYLGINNGAGTRDWSQPGGPIFSGDVVVADPARQPLVGKALLERVRTHKDGHGIDQAAVDYGRAFYTFDVPNSSIRFVVVDTASPTGSADGLILKGDVDQKVKPFLDQSVADGKLVIVTSHHSSSQLTDGGGFGGKAHADAITTDAWRSVLGGYPNILMHLAGHTHHHHVVPIQPMNGRAYWEMETAALADYPHQMRLIEIWDLDNGFYGIQSIAFDYSVEGDPIAAEGRKRGVADFTSGWQKDGSGAANERNIVLLVPKT